jgi:hypothetical protein
VKSQFQRWVEKQFGTKWTTGEEIAEQEKAVDSLRRRLAQEQMRLDKMKQDNLILSVASKTKFAAEKKFEF